MGTIIPTGRRTRRRSECVPYLCQTCRKVVGVAGFEPATPCSQGRCSTKLSHAPSMRKLLYYTMFGNVKLNCGSIQFTKVVFTVQRPILAAALSLTTSGSILIRATSVSIATLATAAATAGATRGSNASTTTKSSRNSFSGSKLAIA